MVDTEQQKTQAATSQGSGVHHDEVVLAVDIGGSKFMVGFVNASGEILASKRYEWHYPTIEEVVATLGDAVEEMLAAYPDFASLVRAGGMTIPGFTNPVTGDWIDSDNPVVRDLPICSLLEQRIGMPFYGDNDGNACVLAESLFGDGRGLDTFFYTTVSSGVGGGVFADGGLYYGAHGESGEVGLIIVEPGGRPSRSGNQIGPLEMYACTEGMAMNYIALGGCGYADPVNIGGKEISEAAADGDECASKAIELEGLYLARAFANVEAMFAPARIIVGGGLSLMFDQYKPYLMAELKRICPDATVEVTATKLGYDGAFLGAAACALRGLAGFDHACGMDDDHPELVVKVTNNGDLLFDLDVAGRVICSGDLGSMLVATGIEDEGRLLKAYLPTVLKEQTSTLFEEGSPIPMFEESDPRCAGLRDFGSALGRVLASCCMVLDPHGISLPPSWAPFKGHIEEPLIEALVCDTYWKRDELPYYLTWPVSV